ncbi:MAG TPA: flagellin [Hyphomonadaceae bacterium]|nr:flagellin [Hyphomonadaceae bacterium]HPN04586.1 flagellin [Hyphomonadaceae bacterium]
MARISSAMIPASSLADISRAQQQLVEAARQSSSQTKATDLKGYGRESQTLVSAERLVARNQSFQANARELTTRMTIQDVALGRAADAVSQLKDTLFQNVSLGSGEGIRVSLNEAFEVLKGAMNTSVGGRYLFGGVMNENAPVTAASLSDLAANPLEDSIATGEEPQFMRVEDSRTIQAGLVADDVISGAFESLKRLTELHEGPDGPFDGPLTPTQRTALESELQSLSAAFNNILTAQSENGRLMKDVDNATSRLTSQYNALDEVIGGITNVDLAEVAVRLNQAQFAYQSSASIFNTLRNMSLLDVLK